MASPYSTGGGGTHFEARVAATYLVAVLCEAPARGLPGYAAREVRAQRALDDEPLDDLVILGALADGRASKLSLQVKSALGFTAKDDEWCAVVKAAWDTFSAAAFDGNCHRVGVAVATYNAKIDRHYQSILTWAANSASGTDFVRRVGTKDFAHADRGAFLEALREVLTSHLGRAPTDDELWRFLKSFVILHFDLNQDDRSRDADLAIDRLRGLLGADDAPHANAVWTSVVAKAGVLIPAAGSASRATLAGALALEGLPAGTPVSVRADLDALGRESCLALAQIRTDIAGVSLFRDKAYDRLKTALTEARFIQIDGEPGAGKSALLKALADECARTGPVFALKDRRVHAKGWSAHAHVLGVCADASVLLREFACAGEPILFIDGVDKIDDPAEQLTINDLVATIANEPHLSGWRIVVSVRAQNLRHIETWLDEAVLRKLGLATVTVETLTAEELGVIATHHPRLAPLMRQSRNLDAILSRPFFIDALLKLVDCAGGRQLPASEVDLLRLWWSLGGADSQEPVGAQHRRNALMQLARLLAVRPSGALPISTLAPEPIAELKAAGVLRDKDLGHSIIFTHDIYEEWTLCEFLLSSRENIADELRAVGEPQALVRPLQLLGTYLLETEPNADAWEALLTSTDDEALRPVWQRAVLSAPLQSTQAPTLLERLGDVLLGNHAKRLRPLLIGLRTIEVVPNALYLNDQTLPGIEPADRVKLAELNAIPKFTPWLRLFTWLVPRLPTLPPSLIPDLLPVLMTWQDACGGQSIVFCREIGVEAHRWLREFEDASHVERWADRRKPFDTDFGYRDDEKLETRIRTLFLGSAGDIPEFARQYLSDLASRERVGRGARHEVMSHCIQLVRHLPAELVDFILAVYLESPDDREDRFGSHHGHLQDELGINGGRDDFYPASPIHLPFLALLRFHEAEGLRLIREMCNHSVRTWRWSRAHPYHYAPATPTPVEVRLPWGKQTFWGDQQVYLWFRGFWGNPACGSALMALEKWALDKLEAGADFPETFQKCLEGHEGVGALGIGVSLSLAQPNKAVESAFPLITSPSIWCWEIARLVNDQPGIRSNEIGDWYRHRTQLQAVRDLNERDHRQHDIRALIPYYVLWHDRALAKRYARAINAFPKRLPFEFEEQKQSTEFVADLRERMAIFVQQGHPKYWKTRPSADRQHVELYNDPPFQQSSKEVARQEEMILFNKATGLSLWARKSLENNAIDDRMTAFEGLALARELDEPELLDIHHQPDELANVNCAGGVAGTAFVLAAFATPAEWTEETAAWCATTLHRAATVVEPDDGISYRGSHALMHPCVFAAHGYAALLARGCEVQVAQNALINLAVDSLDDVVKAVFVSSSRYAGQYPAFARTLLLLAAKQCVSARDEMPNYHSPHWDAAEAEQKTALIEWAESSGDAVPQFPVVPMPWVQDGRSRIRRGKTVEWSRNDQIFRFDLVERTILEVDLDLILADPLLRAPFLAFVANLVDWTGQELAPPFADSRASGYDSTPPFEWIFAFSAWCGKLCAKLSADEAKATVLDRVMALRRDAALQMLQRFMRLFMVYGILKGDAIRPDSLAIWQQATTWLIDTVWPDEKDDRHIDREFQSCAMHIVFCTHNDFDPVFCGVDEGWPHLALFRPTLERAVREFGLHPSLFFIVLTFLKRGGFDLLPDPGLAWLLELVRAKKADQRFWTSNGDSLVDLLRQLVERHQASLNADHRVAVMSIADILVDNGVRGAGFLQQELLREG